MSWEKINMGLLMSEDDDGMGGGGSGSTVEPDDQQQQSQQPTQQPFDANALGRAIVDGLRPALQPQRQQMSEEEFRTHTKYFKVTPTYVKELFGDAEPQVLEQRANLLQQLVDGASGHAISVGNLLAQKMAQDINQNYEPVMTEVQQQRTDRFINRVVNGNQAMKGQDEVVRASINILRSQGFNPQTEDEAVRQVLGVAERILKSANPEFSLQNSQSSGGRAPMPRSAGGVNGSGGSGGGGKQGGQKKSFMSIFE